MRKKRLISLAVIFAVLLLSMVVLNRSHPETDEDIAKCIGENAVLYTQFGCHACNTQENLFGENAKHLSIVDCFVDQNECIGIRATPTWVIKGQSYIGVKSVEELRELTGC